MDATAQTRSDNPMLGITIIVVSVFAMAFADAVVKLVSSSLSIWQVFLVRSLFGVPVLLLIARATRVGFSLKRPGWAILRSVLLVSTWIAYYASLPVLNLSVAAIAVYTNPIIIALLSAWLLGDRVTPRQWIGVFLGFLGVVTILRPGTSGFSWYTVLPLLAALFYALAMILTRSKCRDDQPLLLGLNLHLTFIVTGALGIFCLYILNLDTQVSSSYPFLLDGWASLSGKDLALLALLGVLAGGYFVGVAKAYQIAPSPIIATYDYFYLISAAIWGFVFFAERPDIWVALGMVLITLAGLLVAGRKPA